MISAIIQARMASTRLPGKTMKLLAGKPLIQHVIDRLSFSNTIDNIILATSVSASDDALSAWANDYGVSCYRGSEFDVLDRYYHAALVHNSSVVVRVTADDPFKDPFLIDSVVSFFRQYQLDFAYNNNPPSYPEGLDVEVFNFASLKKAAFASSDSFEREHVTQYFYRNPELFLQKNFCYKQNLSQLRWTIDTEVDYQMAQIVYNHLYVDGSIFTFHDILSFLSDHPEVASINSNVKRSSMYS